MYSFLEYRYVVRSLMMGSEWQVAALIPKAELKGEMGDSQMALQAHFMSKALHKLAHSLNSAQTVLIFFSSR
jgi:RecA/RadA recombinase